MVNAPFKRYKALIAGILVLCTFDALLNVAMALLLKNIIDMATMQSTDSFASILVKIAIYLVCLTASVYAMDSTVAEFKRRCSRDLKNSVINKIIGMDIKGFTSHNSATYISIINNDVKLLESDYYKTVIDVISYIITAVLAIVTLIYFNPMLAVVSVALGLLPAAIPKLLQKQLQTRQHQYSKALESYNAHIKDIFAGFEVLMTFGVGRQAQHAHAVENEATGECGMRLQLAKAKASAFTTGAFFATTLATYLVAVALVLSGRMTLGVMIGSIQMLNYVVNPIDKLMDSYTTLTAAKSVVQKVTTLLATEERPALVSCKQVLPLCCKRLSFSYENKAVVNKLDYCFQPGIKYAIVGESGCGKTTLVKLLTDYYADYSGDILYGTQELRTIDKASVSQSVAMIHQNVSLFGGTIQHNLTLYADYSEEEIAKAVRAAGLEQTVSQLPQGLHTMVEECGHNFSGGERQRISIARALLRKVALLVMDEAMASLDPQTAQSVERDILKQPNMTVISVTHRLTSNILSLYDVILVMHQGEFCEEGSFDELMQRKGEFYQMFLAASKECEC